MLKSYINVSDVEIYWNTSMITKEILDTNGNVVYEEHDDGYWEENIYDGTKLVKSTSHYANGLIEVERYAKDATLHERKE